MIISSDPEIQYPMLKVMERPVVDGSQLNIIKDIYDKSVIKWKKLKAFPRTGVGQGYPLYSYLIVLDVLEKAIRHEKRIKGLQIGREEVKVSLFVDDRSLPLRDPKDATKNFLEWWT